ncbi:retrovirus-related pol polyprotein from transposon TNT 1-94 [Tanacetum coccineum]
MEQLKSSELKLHPQLSEIELMMSSQTRKDSVKLLIEGSEISLQERESKSYDEFDTFTSVPGEIIHSYYLRFTHLINDRHTIGMLMKPLQVNTKFVNHLQLEWSKFVTDVKLAKDLHNTNFDQFGARSNATGSGVNKNGGTPIIGQAKVVRCCNCQEEGHMARQCTKPKRPRNLAWFKEKMLLAEALESGVALEEEKEIPTSAIFQTNDLDSFDSDCDEPPSASVVLMAKLSAYDSEVLLEVPPHDTYLEHHVIDQSVQAMRYSEQPPFNNETNFDITSDNAMIMSMIEEMSSQVAKCNEVNKENKTVNEPSTAELERYKEQIKIFEERHKFDLNDKEKYINGCKRRNINIGKESRLKMHAKQNDAIVKDKKVNIAPIDYAALNKLPEHFVKHFVPQKQLSVEQAFWLPISKPMSKPVFETPPAHKEPVLKEIPHKLPTISLVKDNFNKIRSHVKNFARL